MVSSAFPTCHSSQSSRTADRTALSCLRYGRIAQRLAYAFADILVGCDPAKGHSEIAPGGSFGGNSGRVVAARNI